MADLATARREAEEALADAHKIINRWSVYPHRALKSDLVGHLVILSAATKALLAARGGRS